jgi:hypothetical protein
MPLTTENHFVCGFPGCKVDFYYAAGIQGQPAPNWPDSIRVALNKVVAVTHPLTGYSTFYCCDEHAIEAIGQGIHLPPLPPKVAPATEAELKAAQRGMSIVGAMRNEAKPS